MSDKGFGVFGSVEWHETCINSFDDDKDVIEYIFLARGRKLEPSPTIEETKQKAIEALRLH